MSVRDTQARLATPGDEVIVPADAGQLACLAAIDDADYIIQDEVVLKSGVPEAASLLYNLFKDCDSSKKLAAVLYGSRPNIVLVGEMTGYEKIQNSIKRLLADLPMLGRFVAILLERVSDHDDKPSFLNRALALTSNLPFGCDKLQMADRSLMHIRTHGRFDVWIARSLTNMSAVYEVWIKKTHKETWSPMLYASVLAMFWTIPGVLQAPSPLKIHMLGPSKLLLGLTETGHSLLKTRYRELVAAIGVVLEDLKTRQFLDGDIISKPTVPSTWKKELVGTVYIMDVAPWWYLSDLTEALAPSVQCRYIADRVRWSVGEMRTATWRLTGESVSQLIGKVYLSESGMPPMFVISEADYEARKKRITDRPRNTNDTKSRRQGLITAGEIAKAMELDDQVDKVISFLKRKQDLKEDEASSSNGVAR